MPFRASMSANAGNDQASTKGGLDSKDACSVACEEIEEQETQKQFLAPVWATT
jgi:hypothetical protein